MIKRGGHTSLIIFAIGVVMLLTRPYFVYALTSGHAAKSNPVKTWRLLQRLVKKKDDHHDYVAEAAILATQTRAITSPERTLSAALCYPGTNNKFVTARQIALNKLLIPIQRHRYLLISCFLI